MSRWAEVNAMVHAITIERDFGCGASEIASLADDSLTDLAQAQRARTEIVKAVHQNELALAAARQGYTEGAIDSLNVIFVQAALLQSQGQLVNVDTEINTRLVGLYRSLGGGWEIAN